ncbi:MAG: FkbM family methyltransferase [Paracoccaceae bacterium]
MNKNTTREFRQDDYATTDIKQDDFGTFAPGTLQQILIRLAQRTFLGRGNFRRWMSYAIARLGAPVDVIRKGCKFRLYLRNNLIDFGLLLKEDYNQIEIDFLTSDLGPDSVAVDIGSNIGLYTMPMAKTGAKVVAIEANPQMVEQLRCHVRLNGFEHVELFPCAVGDKSGAVNLNIRRDDVAIVNVVESAHGHVQMQMLQTILDTADVTRIDALKIDIEGFEDRALGPFLDTCSPALLPKRMVLEELTQADHPRCKAAMKRHGYVFVKNSRSNALYELRGF